MSFITFFQLLCALGWSGAAIMFAPDVWWAVRGRVTQAVAVRAVIWFVAMSQIGFIVRWFAWRHTVEAMGNDELAAWSGLYLLSAIAGAANTYVAWIRTGGWHER